MASDILSDFSGGVNRRGQPLAIGETDLLACQNMYPIASGSLIGRGGQTLYNATPIDAQAIKSLYRFYKQSGLGLTLATSGTNVHLGNDSLGGFGAISTGYTSGRRFSFTTWTAKD